MGQSFSLEGTEAHQSWVKDGTVAAAPVTESTPVLTDQPSTGDLSSIGSGGGGASAVPADTSPTGKAAPSTPAPATPDPNVQAVADFIEAQLADGKPFQIPKGVKLPWKRGNETGYESVDVVLKRHMLDRDYRIKTAEVARHRKELEAYAARVRQVEARIAVERQEVEEERKRQRAALSDPKELEALEAHYERIEKDPRYRKTHEDALAKRTVEAELAEYRAMEEERATHEIAQELNTAIVRIVGAQYPGVDPEAVRVRYAQALQSGQAQLDEAEIHRFARQEAETAARYARPLQTEIATLKAQAAEAQELKERLAKLEARDAKNATTQHAINRSKAPNTAPAGGSPPGAKSKEARKPYPSAEFEGVLRDWSSRRD